MRTFAGNRDFKLEPRSCTLKLVHRSQSGNLSDHLRMIAFCGQITPNKQLLNVFDLVAASVRNSEWETGVMAADATTRHRGAWRAAGRCLLVSEAADRKRVAPVTFLPIPSHLGHFLRTPFHIDLALQRAKGNRAGRRGRPHLHVHSCLVTQFFGPCARTRKSIGIPEKHLYPAWCKCPHSNTATQFGRPVLRLLRHPQIQCGAREPSGTALSDGGVRPSQAPCARVPRSALVDRSKSMRCGDPQFSVQITRTICISHRRQLLSVSAIFGNAAVTTCWSHVC